MDYKQLEPSAGIYIITNTINNKVYIGQSRMKSKNPNRCGLRGRGRAHFIALRNNRCHNNKLQEDWNIQQNQEAFTIQSLIYCIEEELDYWEEYYIKQYNATNSSFGYNILSKPGWSEHHKAEINARIGQSNKGKVMSDEAKAKCSAYAKANPSPNFIKKGDHLPEWWKEKISKGNKGKKLSEEHKKKLSRTPSEETKKKISDSLKGYKQSPESREKSRLGHVGLKYNKKSKS